MACNCECVCVIWLHTTVGVDAVVVEETHAQVVQHSGLVQERERCQVIFTLQYIRVSQRRQTSRGHHRVLHLLRRNNQGNC